MCTMETFLKHRSNTSGGMLFCLLFDFSFFESLFLRKFLLDTFLWSFRRSPMEHSDVDRIFPDVPRLHDSGMALPVQTTTNQQMGIR